jgi:hypothetical protein
VSEGDPAVGPTQPDPLTPELREVESLMEQALTEACDTEAPSEVDTGELIRVEEMLEIASDAAKQAIALRRKRRETRQRTAAGAAEMGAAEAAASQETTHRSFTDPSGVVWDVFAVYPEARLSPRLRGTFPQGWLCFDSGPEKRRLSPIPENWQALSDGELERLAARAERARPRRRSRSGDDDPGPTESRPPAGE